MNTEIAVKKVHLASTTCRKEGVGIEPDPQYVMSIMVEAGRQFDVTAIRGSQFPAIGLHWARYRVMVIMAELAKRAIVTKSKALSHLRKPPILNRNRATEIFTTQIVRIDKILEMKNNFPI